MTQMEQLNVSREMAASPTRVFEAWTSPEQIVGWWGGGGVTCPEAQVDLRQGGTYRIANALPDGSTTWISGVFEVIERPNRLVYTWSVEPADPIAAPSIVEVDFTAVGDGTLVTVNQTRIPNIDARHMFEAGWNGCLDGLKTLLGAATTTGAVGSLSESDFTAVLMMPRLIGSLFSQSGGLLAGMKTDRAASKANDVEPEETNPLIRMASPGLLLGEARAKYDAIPLRHDHADQANKILDATRNEASRLIGIVEMEMAKAGAVPDDQLRNHVLNTARQVRSIIDVKADRQSVEGYVSWLMKIAVAAVEATSSGGFLGFGGQKVSEEEHQTLSMLAVALGAR